MRHGPLLALALACNARAPASQPTTPSGQHLAELPDHLPDHLDEAPHVGLPTRVSVSPDVLREAGVRTDKATLSVLEQALSLPGELVANPDRSARVSSPVAGRIERVAFQEGQAVVRNQLLVVVRVPEVGHLRGALDVAKARAKAARANVERLRALLQDKLTSAQAVLDAEAQASAHELEAQSLDDQLRALGAAGAGGELELRAPIDGIALSRNAVVGQPLSPADTLTELADMAELWFLARVFEKDLGRLHQGEKAEVRLNAYPKERFLGVIAHISKQVDPAARTLTARIPLKNRAELLRVGLFGKAEVALQDEPATSTPVLIVPRNAVVELAGKPNVFVREPDGDFERHEVVLGRAAPGRVEVVTGLRAGEDIVVEGAALLKALAMKQTVEGD